MGQTSLLTNSENGNAINIMPNAKSYNSSGKSSVACYMLYLLCISSLGASIYSNFRQSYLEDRLKYLRILDDRISLLETKCSDETADSIKFNTGGGDSVVGNSVDSSEQINLDNISGNDEFSNVVRKLSLQVAGIQRLRRDVSHLQLTRRSQRQASIQQSPECVCPPDCNDYSMLRTHPESINPHLMEIVEDGDSIFYSSCRGMLISKDFILTSNLTWRLGGLSMGNFTVRKALVIGDQHQDGQSFRIARYIPLNTSKYKHFSNEIGLLQLREAIPFHNSLSIFRPACLWTGAILPESVNYRIFQYSSQFLRPLSFQIIKDDECLIPINSDGVLRGPYLCLNVIGDTEENYTREWTILLGTALEANVHNQRYVVGILLKYKGRTAIAIKISDIISQIESVVWPDGYKPISGCGQRKVIHKPLMTFSLPTYHGEYPWHVALYRSEGGRNKVLKYICGGTIINKRTVVTAAHCVENELGLLPANRLTIVAGIHNLNEYTIDTQNYVVQNITVHEEYNRIYLENDIALIKLRYPITFSPYIQPICLRNNSDFNTTIGTVVGWGLNELQQPSDTLLQADLPIRTNKDCRDSNRDFFPMYLNENNFCAGNQNGTSVCSGDSGGGLIFEDESQFYIRGIVSLGPAVPRSNKCDISQLVLFTDITKFYNWIKVNTDNDE